MTFDAARALLQTQMASAAKTAELRHRFQADAVEMAQPEP